MKFLSTLNNLFNLEKRRNQPDRRTGERRSINRVSFYKKFFPELLSDRRTDERRSYRINSTPITKI